MKLDVTARCVFLGAPGAGKGTQAKQVAEAVQASGAALAHISTGDMLRAQVAAGTELGAQAKGFMDQGQLVPDEVTVKMWAQNIHAQKVLAIYKPHDDLLVLDGIPRSKHQAELMEEYCNVLGVLHLVCPDKDAMMKRLRRRALKENRALTTLDVSCKCVCVCCGVVCVFAWCA